MATKKKTTPRSEPRKVDPVQVLEAARRGARAVKGRCEQDYEDFASEAMAEAYANDATDPAAYAYATAKKLAFRSHSGGKSFVTEGEAVDRAVDNKSYLNWLAGEGSDPQNCVEAQSDPDPSGAHVGTFDGETPEVDGEAPSASNEGLPRSTPTSSGHRSKGPRLFAGKDLTPEDGKRILKAIDRGVAYLLSEWKRLGFLLNRSYARETQEQLFGKLRVCQLLVVEALLPCAERFTDSSARWKFDSTCAQLEDVNATMQDAQADVLELRSYAEHLEEEHLKVSPTGQQPAGTPFIEMKKRLRRRLPKLDATSEKARELIGNGGRRGRPTEALVMIQKYGEEWKTNPEFAERMRRRDVARELMLWLFRQAGVPSKSLNRWDSRLRSRRAKLRKRIDDLVDGRSPRRKRARRETGGPPPPRKDRYKQFLVGPRSWMRERRGLNAETCVDAPKTDSED